MKLTEIERPWLDEASRCASSFALMIPRFNSDQLRECVARFTGPPLNRNLWGVLLAKLRNSGVIRRVGYTRSQRPAANGRIVGVWRSRI